MLPSFESPDSKIQDHSETFFGTARRLANGVGVRESALTVDVGLLRFESEAGHLDWVSSPKRGGMSRPTQGYGDI